MSRAIIQSYNIKPDEFHSNDHNIIEWSDKEIPFSFILSLLLFEFTFDSSEKKRALTARTSLKNIFVDLLWKMLFNFRHLKNMVARKIQSRRKWKPSSTDNETSALQSTFVITNYGQK